MARSRSNPRGECIGAFCSWEARALRVSSQWLAARAHSTEIAPQSGGAEPGQRLPAGYLHSLNASAGRRRFLIGLGAFGTVLVTWAVLAGMALLSARREIREALRAIDVVRTKAGPDVVQSGVPAELLRARDLFARAHRRVDGALLAPAQVVPVAGRQLRSVRALSEAANEVATVVAAGIAEAQPLLSEPAESTAQRASAMRRLGELAGRTRSRLRQVRLGPERGLVGPLGRSRQRLARELGDARVALRKTEVGATALAGMVLGPRRYLLLAANNAEMRAGSGMFLSAGELETSPQGIALNDMKSVTDIPIPADSVPLTGDLADRWGWLRPNVEWRNLMASPRFDASAPVAARMWLAAGHRPVEGVVALDPAALGELLAAIGPVDVDGRRFSEDNVEEELFHLQYLRFPENTSERREQLASIAKAVFSALDQRDWPVARLAAGLASAARGRHLMVWSDRVEEQSVWTLLGVDGSLRHDSVLLSVLNRGGNKLDYFLSIAADVKVAPVGKETEVTVALHLENRVPEGEPTYVAGPHGGTGVGEGVYLGIVALDVPAAAYQGRFDGVDQLAVAGRDGPCQVMGFQIALPRGARRTIVGRFRLPGRSGTVRVEPSARVPPVRWQRGRSAWSDESSHVFTWGKIA